MMGTQKKRKASKDLAETEHCKHKKLKQKETVKGRDSESDSDLTPQKKMKEKKKKASKADMGWDSDNSTGDTPLIKKAKRDSKNLNEKHSDRVSKNKERGWDSDNSTGDTPLIKKTKRNRENFKETNSDQVSDNTTVEKKEVKKGEENHNGSITDTSIVNSSPDNHDLKPSENIVGKGENAGNQHFLLFPQCFLPFLNQISIFSPVYFVICKCFQFGLV